MTESASEPVQRWQVGAVLVIVSTTLALGSFAYTMQAEVSRLERDKANKSDVHRILDLLCDQPDNAAKRACREING